MIMTKDSNNNYVKIEDIITQQNNFFNGISPIKFKSSGENLENYRIYGNTVGGESVGDRTRNLFDENSESIPGFLNDGGAIATVPNYPISTYDYINVLPNTNYSYKAFIDAGPNNSTHKTIRVSYYTNSKVFISRYFEIDKGLTKKTITTPNNCFYIRLSIDDNLRNVMLWRGSSDVSVYEPYGYKVSVVCGGTTTNLYLPEQIKMVDDEAEYIDFEEQKQHFADGTSIDVTLPALPTFSGTNTLSVETNTKPSKVWGKLSDLRDILYVKDNLGNILFSKYHEIEGEPPLIYKPKKADTLIDYRIYGQTENGENVGDLITEGEHAGEYEVPVTVEGKNLLPTTNIYLPEQIKMVGDEAEYVDYQEQKLHRVRKNLLQNTASSQTKNGVTFTVNNDGSVTCDGTASNNTFFKIGDFSLASQSYILTGCPSNGGNDSYMLRCYKNGNIKGEDVGNGFNINESIDGYIEIRITSGYTCNNLIFYPMIRKADITDDTYESYITSTELDVTLPALPTLSGINTLSVGTEVQPSKVYLKGKIEEIPTRTVSYYSQDGSTLLGTETVESGGNASGLQDTPTKPDTEQYTYTFVGWSNTTNATTAMSGILNNITADKSVYAAFSETARTYTVYFYNGETLLETVIGVPSGGTATYTGATPTSSQTGYIFSGWSPSNTNITADTSCYAQFEEDDMYESITDTWSEIIANVSNGTYSSKYSVGDTKLIDLGTEGKVIMTIVGIDTDDLADNSGKAPITWISKQLLKTSHRMNPPKQSGTSGTGALGGWGKTEMRSYLKETVKPLIPETVRNAIKPVKKYSMIYNASGSAISNVLTTEDVWIPSYQEVFGNYSAESSGVYYSTAFPDNASRIKRKAGSSAAWWWLRSANASHAFYRVVTDGSKSYDYAHFTGDVALGFCT